MYVLGHPRYRTWWRHEMETLSALLALCEGNPPVTGGFPLKRQWRGVVFFDLRLNKHLSKQSRCRWIETPSRSLWRHRNEKVWTRLDNLLYLSPHLATNEIMQFQHKKVRTKCKLGTTRSNDNRWVVEIRNKISLVAALCRNETVYLYR